MKVIKNLQGKIVMEKELIKHNDCMSTDKKAIEDKLLLEKLHLVLESCTSSKFLAEDRIHDQICGFRKKELSDKQSFPLDSELFYEEIAFALEESLTQCSSKVQGWEGLTYRPMYSLVNKEGYSTPRYPNIKHITPEMVNYWEKRSNNVENSTLLQRYAGLVWDFSKKIRQEKPDVKHAHKFIDSTKKIVQQLDKDNFHAIKYKLEKSLDIAVSINDKSRIFSIRDAIICHEDMHSEDDKAGTWGYSFDWLIEDKTVYKKVQLEESQEEKIIAELERRLKIVSDLQSSCFNLHHVESIVTRLALYYRTKNNLDNMKRVLLIYRDAFLYGTLPLLARASLLREVWGILFQYGLSEEAKKIEPEIRKSEKEGLRELKKHEVKITIPQEDIDNYLNNLDGNSLSESLKFIAVYNISTEQACKEIALRNLSPLLSLISQQKIEGHTGRVVSEVGPIEEDLYGHIINQMCQSIQINIYFIDLGLSHLEKNNKLNANLLSEHIFKSPVFPKNHHQIIKHGIDKFFEEDYISSISTLIPQIEKAIRQLILDIGGVAYQSPSNHEERGFMLRPLGALLRDNKFINFFKQFEHKILTNIPLYFQVLLTDSRGMNLRNDICHGQFPSNYFHRGNAILVIHALLVLSLFQKSKKHRIKI